jgi:hypothetical protein
MTILVIGLIVLSLQQPAYAHKPIDSDGTNNNFSTALLIPDHKISWVIYENISPNGIKFYKFQAKSGDNFYAQIVVPKLKDLVDFTPTLVLVGPGQFLDNVKISNLKFPEGVKYQIFSYQGLIPSKEFYEPFGQVTYWQRQEVRTVIPSDGTYYLVVFDTQGKGGKYSLAVGEIEDFKPLDFLTILPTAWFKTKLFFDDYTSFAIGVLVISGIILLIVLGIIRIKKRH